MDRNDFQKRMQQPNTWTDDDIRAGVTRMINVLDDNTHFRGWRNILVCAEECGELSQELIKSIRGKYDRVGLLEEAADIAVGLKTIQEVFNISDEELLHAQAVKVQVFEEKNANAQPGTF